ncbi:hypothetical protein GGI43DRAFT_383620 [Trichoderma evansii]
MADLAQETSWNLEADRPPHNDASSATIQSCTQANISLIPEDLSLCIHLTLSDEDQRPPLKDCTQANISLIPEDLGFCIRQFLFDQEQNTSADTRQTPGETEAESNMSIQLHAFDTKFNKSSIDNGSANK